MSRVLVTGGGGFVGLAIVKKLLEQGRQVVVVGRHQYPEVLKLGGIMAQGDIRQQDFLTQACRDCDTVFHVAAKAGVWGTWQEYNSINVLGTENVLKACQANGVSQLIYTSTPSVVFDCHDIQGGDESLPYPQEFLCHYARSKSIAEKMVLDGSAEGLRTVALRPHLIWGPGDGHLIPRLLERGRKQLLKQVGDGSNMVDISYIDNVVDAHLLAAQDLAGPGRSAGNAYFISQGQPINLWDWINGLFERLSIHKVEKKVSHGKAYLAGQLMEWLYGLLRIEREPLMTRFLAEQLARSHWFSIEAAKRDFGYQPKVTTAEGLDRLVAWLRQHHLN